MTLASNLCLSVFLRACVAGKYQLSHGFTNTKLYNLESRILVLPNIEANLMVPQIISLNVLLLRPTYWAI